MLETAIISHIGTQITALGGRIHGDTAPQKEATPYMVFSIVDSDPVHSFGGDSGLTQATVFFEVYSQNKTTIAGTGAGDVVKQLKSIFRNYINGDSTSKLGGLWVQTALIGTGDTDYVPSLGLFVATVTITIWYVDV